MFCLMKMNVKIVCFQDHLCFDNIISIHVFFHQHQNWMFWIYAINNDNNDKPKLKPGAIFYTLKVDVQTL